MMNTYDRFLFANFVSTARSQLLALADFWLSIGASSFALCDDEGYALLHCGAAHGWISADLCQPLTLGEAVLGTLRVSLSPAPEHDHRLYTDALLVSSLLQMENNLEQMTEELVSSQDQLLALYQLARSIRGVISLEELIITLTTEAAKLLKVDSAGLIIERASGLNITQVPPHRLDIDFWATMFRQVQQRERFVLVNHADETDDTGEAGAQPAIHNLLITPIWVQGKLIAALGFCNKRDGRFSSPDLKLARAVAEEAGVQIERTLLHQESLTQARLTAEIDFAADIQARLLPASLPSIAGLEIEAALTQAQRVGGDFYDVLPQPDGDLIVVVADVAGKGLSSALLMAMTRAVIRSQVNLRPSVEDVLTLTNNDLYNDYTEVSMFATAFVARWDHDRGVLNYANAGHAPVIYRPAPGGARLLPAHDLPLGVLQGISYQQRTLNLFAGDVVVILSDGFSEARDTDGQLFGLERLLWLVENCAHLDAVNIKNAIMETIRAFSDGHPQDDDQTLVVIKRPELLT
jgi:sigma-B regulation protein RsbU (phosphoserine phosphatase)